MLYTIGVVIVARNAESFITQALESVKNQTLKPNQVVVVDDGSTDGTASILEAWQSQIPHLILIKTNQKGIGPGRNIGNEACQTDYIAVLDSDDLLDSQAIQAYAEFIYRHKDADLIYADCAYFWKNPTQSFKLAYSDFSSSSAYKWRIMGGLVIPFKHSGMLYRKSTVMELGGYDENLKEKLDVDLFLKFVTRNKQIFHLGTVTALHRKHQKQLSVKRRVSGIKTYYKLIDRYEAKPLYRLIFKVLRTVFELSKALFKM